MIVHSTQTTCDTGVLPVPTPAYRPTEIVDLEYSPTLLLPSDLDHSITHDRSFSEGCEDGFDCYADDLCTSTGDFVDRFFSRDKVRLTVAGDAVNDNPQNFLSLSRRAGFSLGWLSALALAQPQEAYDGLVFLRTLFAPPEPTDTALCPLQYFVVPRFGPDELFDDGQRYCLAFKYKQETCPSVEFKFHRGSRTNKIVTFIRYADAVRLADRRNADLRL